MNLHTEAVNYQHNGTHLTGMLVWDQAGGEMRPGVLVVHGGAGLDDHVKGRAKRFAEMGFVAFACDMYGDGVAGDRQRVMQRIAELRDAPGKLVGRASAGMDVLRESPLVDGRIAAVGYCFGGMTVLELARSGAAFAGAVSVHGSLSTGNPAEPGKIRPKILVCHGALDPHVPMAQVNAFVEEMNHAGADWEVVLYGGAMHGFTHEHGPAMPGVAYDAHADARSQREMQGFFLELFGAGRG